MANTNEIPIAIKFGMSAFLGLPSVNRLDHVRLPNEKIKGPKYINCYIAVLTRSLPGKGRLLLSKSNIF